MKNQKLNFGLDEVGRGALAGPVVAGSCAFNKRVRSLLKTEKRGEFKRFVVKGDDILICDSKKMTPAQRIIANLWIKQNAASFGVGVGRVYKINGAGIVSATNFAFRSAFKASNNGTRNLIDNVFIDAFFIPRLGNIRKMQQTPVVHGDSLIFEIAAASIIAKVYRDNLMQELSIKKKFLDYNWSQNKGYGTKEHINAIKSLGVTKHHRKLFVKNFI